MEDIMFDLAGEMLEQVPEKITFEVAEKMTSIEVFRR